MLRKIKKKKSHKWNLFIIKITFRLHICCFWVVPLYLMSTKSLSTELIHKKHLSQKEHTYATVMQASLTTWDLRSFAESLSAPSNKRKCWKKQSYCAAPATSNDRIFLS